MSRPWLPLLCAWLVSIVATGSAVFIGEVMGMTPCVLCWYQRCQPGTGYGREYPGGQGAGRPRIRRHDQRDRHH